MGIDVYPGQVAARYSQAFKPVKKVRWNGKQWFLDEPTGRLVEGGYTLQLNSSRKYVGLFHNLASFNEYLDKSKVYSRGSGDVVHILASDFKNSGENEAKAGGGGSNSVTTPNNPPKLPYRNAFFLHKGPKDAEPTDAEQLDRVGGIQSAINVLQAQDPISQIADGLVPENRKSFLVCFFETKDESSEASGGGRITRYAGIRTVKGPNDISSFIKTCVPGVVLTDSTEELSKVLPIVAKYIKPPKKEKKSSGGEDDGEAAAGDGAHSTENLPATQPLDDDEEDTNKPPKKRRRNGKTKKKSQGSSEVAVVPSTSSNTNSNIDAPSVPQ